MLLLVLFSCKEDSKNIIEKNPLPPPPGILNRPNNFIKEEIENSLNGIYTTQRNDFGGTSLVLYKDGFYEYISSSCLFTDVDSGFITIKSDSFIFKTLIKTNDTSKDNHKQIAHLKFAIGNEKKIIFPFYIGSKKDSQILYKLNVGHDNFNLLDKNGNGNSFKLDTLNRIIEEGKYENFKLLKGWKKNYQNTNNDYGTTTYYKNGKIDTSRN